MQRHEGREEKSHTHIPHTAVNYTVCCCGNAPRPSLKGGSEQQQQPLGARGAICTWRHAPPLTPSLTRPFASLGQKALFAKSQLNLSVCAGDKWGELFNTHLLWCDVSVMTRAGAHCCVHNVEKWSLSWYLTWTLYFLFYPWVFC